MILTIFLDNALENLKYRKQMQFPVRLKVEAYSFLDLALSFLGKYKADGTVEKYSETTNPSVNKDSNKLIFDEEIISSGSSPDSRLVNNASITRYITKKISDKASINMDTTPGKLKHGELFTIEYSFEDLSAKLPLCGEFDANNNQLLQNIIDRLSVLGLNSQQKSAFKTAITKNLLTKWSTVEKILRDSYSGGNPPEIDLENLKKYFTIEPCIIEAAKIKPPSAPSAPSATPPSSTPFKINLLTVEPEISNALVSLTGIAFPTPKTISNYDALIQSIPFCSLEVQFFSLKVCVSTGINNSYVIRCICKTEVAGGSSANSTSRRLPFNIIKIEEF
jgi:hypothetical protein